MNRVTSALVVSNDQIDLFLIENVVLTSGIFNQVCKLKSGSSAIAYLSTLEKNIGYIDQIIPKLIFLDLGSEGNKDFIQKFNQIGHELRKKIKVILLTLDEDPTAHLSLLMDHSVIGTILKPMIESDLHYHCNLLLSKKLA